MQPEFLDDFFYSLDNQTYKNFDIIVVNDGYENLFDITAKYKNLSIIELSASGTPAKNRQYGINYCLECGYDMLVFGDSDDYFSHNRIELSLNLLADWDIVVNDLSLFNCSGVYEDRYISNRVKNNTAVASSFIYDKNIFGLSNTAVRLKQLNEVVFDENLVAVDWKFYKDLLRKGYSAIFTNDTITYYRQHGDNTVGLNDTNGKYYLWWEKKVEK
jgi:glycosyltransferase involved in cell wall biosynthesis